ncbi:MAG TPA: hypothetical protein PKW63_01195 [Vicinamibacterales bacterium]|nr:hypothetical protein [Vicinamibacterales bacterium]
MRSNAMTYVVPPDSEKAPVVPPTDPQAPDVEREPNIDPPPMDPPMTDPPGVPPAPMA